jgi:hypothetical protein
VVAQRPGQLVQVRPLGGDHPALARRDRLARVEAEAAHLAEVARVLARVPGAERAGRVFDDPQVVLARELHHRPHVRAQAEEVDGDDAHGARRNKGFELTHVEVEGVQRHVAEDGPSAHVLDRVGRRHPREGGDYDFVAGPEAQGRDGEVQGRRAGADGGGVRRTGEGGELLLELLDERALNDPPGFERDLRGAHLFGAEEGLADGNRHISGVCRARRHLGGAPWFRAVRLSGFSLPGYRPGPAAGRRGEIILILMKSPGRNPRRSKLT